MHTLDHPQSPRWIQADAYLFDIDGTLLNAYGGAHYHAFNIALKRCFGVDSTIDGVPWHGSTDVAILRAVLERDGVDTSTLEARVPEMIRHMADHVEANRAQVRSETCNGIPELVRHLHAQGKLLGVASGNFERIGWVKVEAAGLREYFSFGAFSDVSEHRSEIFRHGIALARQRAGEKASICIVGDTPADIKAARENGVPVVAVATGVYSVEQLQAYSPDLLLSCCADVLPLSA